MRGDDLAVEFFQAPARPAEFDGEPAELSPAYRNDAVLSDGGVYDNLGLETAIKRYRTLLVSDGGRPTAPDMNPRDDWARHSYRIIEILQQQISSLRLRQLIQTFKNNDRAGAYWGLRTPVGDYGLDSGINVPLTAHQRLASTETRLAAINDRTQEQLINLAYALCDTAIRRYFRAELAPPESLPYPSAGF